MNPGYPVSPASAGSLPPNMMVPPMGIVGMPPGMMVPPGMVMARGSPVMARGQPIMPPISMPVQQQRVKCTECQAILTVDAIALHRKMCIMRFVPLLLCWGSHISGFLSTLQIPDAI